MRLALCSLLSCCTRRLSGWPGTAGMLKQQRSAASSPALSCGPPWRQRRSRREFRAAAAYRLVGRGETRPAAKNESAVFIGILGFARFHICAGSIFLSEAFFESPSISIELEIRKIRMAGCVSASRGLTNQNPYILP